MCAVGSLRGLIEDIVDDGKLGEIEAVIVDRLDEGFAGNGAPAEPTGSGIIAQIKLAFRTVMNTQIVTAEVLAGIIDEDYTITFGELRGFIRDEDGNEYKLDGMTAIGEDKSLRI